MNRLLAAAAGFVGVLLLLSALTGLETMHALVACLPLGWWYFLRRNLALATVNWPFIASGFVCSLIILVLGYFLLRGLHRRHLLKQAPAPSSRAWSWKWTLALYASIWILFAIAFGAAGVFRHAVWLLQLHQPWYESTFSLSRQLRDADICVRELLIGTNEDLDLATRQYPSLNWFYRPHSLLIEEFEVLFFADSSNRVAVYVILSRTNPVAQDARFLVRWLPDHYELQPLAELPATLARLEADYPR